MKRRRKTQKTNGPRPPALSAGGWGRRFFFWKKRHGSVTKGERDANFCKKIVRDIIDRQKENFICVEQKTNRKTKKQHIKDFLLLRFGRQLSVSIKQIKFVNIGNNCGLDVLTKNINTGISSIHKQT